MSRPPEDGVTRIGMAIDPDRLVQIQRRRNRWRRSAEIAIAVVATIQLAGAGWVVSQRSVSTAVQVDALLAEVRTEDPAAASRPRERAAGAAEASQSTTPVGTDVSTAVPDDAVQVAGPADESAAPDADDAPVAEESSPATGASSDPAPAPAAPVLDLPAEGVYAYDSEGYESISLGGARHDYPEETFGIVEHGGGCAWSFDHRVLEEKRSVNSYCQQGPTQDATAYDGYITFYGSTAESHYTCTGTRVDLRDRPGDSHLATCDDGESTTSDTITFVGVEPMDIGGVTVQAHHYHVDTIVRGSVQGTSTQEFWVHPDDGLLLRLERQTDTSAYEFGAQVDYVERARFQLTDLSPRR